MSRAAVMGNASAKVSSIGTLLTDSMHHDLSKNRLGGTIRGSRMPKRHCACIRPLDSGMVWIVNSFCERSYGENRWLILASISSCQKDSSGRSNDSQAAVNPDATSTYVSHCLAGRVERGYRERQRAIGGQVFLLAVFHAGHLHVIPIPRIIKRSNADLPPCESLVFGGHDRCFHVVEKDG